MENNTQQQEESVRECQDWLSVKLIRAMFDLGPDLKTRNHPEGYIGEWRQVTYEEVYRATGLSKSAVKRMYWDLWYEGAICIRIHRPKGDEMADELVTGRNGVTDVQMHIIEPWLRFNYAEFVKDLPFSLDVEKYGVEEAFRRAKERENSGWEAGRRGELNGMKGATP